MPLYEVEMKVVVTTYAHDEAGAGAVADRAIQSDYTLAKLESLEVVATRETGRSS